MFEIRRRLPCDSFRPGRDLRAFVYVPRGGLGFHGASNESSKNEKMAVPFPAKKYLFFLENKNGSFDGAESTESLNSPVYLPLLARQAGGGGSG